MSFEDKGVSHFLGRMLPKYVREDYPDFVQFLQSFFEYVERDGGEWDAIANLAKYTDIDRTVEEFLDYHRAKYAVFIPDNMRADFRKLVKNIRGFYLARGTQRSYEYLFRAIFDTYVTIYYPSVDILRASDGMWFQPYFLYPNPNTSEAALPFVEKQIRGRTSGATAFVEKLSYSELPNDPGNVQLVMQLINVFGSFVSGEVVEEVGNVTHTFTLQSTNGYFKTSGYWLNSDGFLSWDKKLQDNNYYQDFSYVVQSELPKEAYENLLLDNVHPAGMKMFTEVKARNSEILDADTIIDITRWFIYWWELVYCGNDLTPTSSVTIKPQAKTVSFSLDYSGFERIKGTVAGDYYAKNIRDIGQVKVGEFITNSPDSTAFLFMNGRKVTNHFMVGRKFNGEGSILSFATAPTSGSPVKALSGLIMPVPTKGRYLALGNGVQAAYSLPYAATDANRIMVFHDGRKLRYDISRDGKTFSLPTSTTLQLSSALANNVPLEVVFLESHAGFSRWQDGPQTFNGNGSTKEFSLAKKPENGLSGNLLVFVDGYYMRPDIDYRIDGTTLKMEVAPASGTKILEVYHLTHLPHRAKSFDVDGVKTQFEMNCPVGIEFHRIR